MNSGIKKKIEIICGADTAQRFEHYVDNDNRFYTITEDDLKILNNYLDTLVEPSEKVRRNLSQALGYSIGYRDVTLVSAIDEIKWCAEHDYDVSWVNGVEDALLDDPRLETFRGSPRTATIPEVRRVARQVLHSTVQAGIDPEFYGNEDDDYLNLNNLIRVIVLAGVPYAHIADFILGYQNTVDDIWPKARVWRERWVSETKTGWPTSELLWLLKAHPSSELNYHPNPLIRKVFDQNIEIIQQKISKKKMRLPMSKIWSKADTIGLDTSGWVEHEGFFGPIAYWNLVISAFKKWDMHLLAGHDVDNEEKQFWLSVFKKLNDETYWELDNLGGKVKIDDEWTANLPQYVMKKEAQATGGSFVMALLEQGEIVDSGWCGTGTVTWLQEQDSYRDVVPPK